MKSNTVAEAPAQRASKDEGGPPRRRLGIYRDGVAASDARRPETWVPAAAPLPPTPAPRIPFCMPVAVTPEWWKIALYAAVAAVVLFGLFRIPKVGAVIRGAFSLALLGLFIFVVLRQAPFEPALAGIADKLGLSGQAVAGREVRIRMSPDGHFWAAASVNALRRAGDSPRASNRL